MKLFYSPMSPNCRKVTALAAFIGSPVEMHVTDIMKGGTETPEFIKKNPNGMVPLLEDGKFCLWESNAIMQYIADKKGATEVWPEDLQTRAEICRWQFWEANHFSEPALTLSYENFFKAQMGTGSPDRAVVEEATEQFHTVARILNKHLETNKFMVGTKPTLADFSIAACLTYAEQAKVPLNEYRHITDWYTRMEKLDAWKKTTPQGNW